MRVERTLKQLAEDPFHPTLHSHKLKGELAGAWACTVDYDNRVLFEFVRNPESGEEEILLLTMGTHDEVY
jgi:mRNA-degrading endonuclease YafQ of YafQ-DinJ toxin-antitoxin module